MKMKIAIMLLMAMMIPAALSAEQGIGIILGEPTGITYKTGNLVIDAGWSVASSSDNRLDVIVDWWLINDDFIEMLDWYLGVGGKAGIKTNQGNDNSDTLYVGARVPIGAQWWITDEFELFGEIAPGLLVIPGIDFDLGAGIGLRYHF